MAEKEKVFEQTLKQKGFFNFSELYNFCYEWLKEENFNVSEEKYNEKISGGGKDIVIKWVAKKKMTDYFRDLITVEWQVIGLNDAEAEINGRKEKTNKGEVKIKITGELERDYEDKWDKEAAWKFLRGIYDKYIIRTTMDQYEDRVIDDAETLFNQIKSFLALEGKR